MSGHTLYSPVCDSDALKRLRVDAAGDPEGHPSRWVFDYWPSCCFIISST
jgi:hypothetical protein